MAVKSVLKNDLTNDKAVSNALKYLDQNKDINLNASIDRALNIGKNNTVTNPLVKNDTINSLEKVATNNTTPPPTANYTPIGGASIATDNSAASALANHLANPVSPWTGGQYGQALQQAMDKITNREKFSYDLNGDALYQQYKDKYINQGRMAMMDTLGQTTALTGGYGNSYAATAGNQAYQGYLQNLNDVVPQLYQMAYDKYNQEGQDLNNIYSMYNQQYNQDYGIYRDQVADWNAETNRLTDAYNQAQSLALQKAKLAQDAAQFNAEMQYKYDALNAKPSVGSSSGSSGSGDGKLDLGGTTVSLDGNGDAIDKDAQKKYKSWNESDWEKYFALIRKEDGSDAALEELQYFIDKGLIPSKMTSYASIGARGSMGH